MGCLGAALFQSSPPRAAPVKVAIPAADLGEPKTGVLVGTGGVPKIVPAGPVGSSSDADSESDPSSPEDGSLQIEPPRVDPAELVIARKTDPSLPEVQPMYAGPDANEAGAVVLSDREKAAGLQVLLDAMNDPAELNRLLALQLLLDDPGVSEATMTSALRAALQDPDPAFVARAIQELAGRSDDEAGRTLSEALKTGMPETRRLIIESVASNDTASDLLYAGLKDPDETVRSTAQEILTPTP